MLEPKEALQEGVDDVTFRKLVSDRWLWLHHDGESESASFAGNKSPLLWHSQIPHTMHTMISA
jgi:hypothetical protein